MERLYGRAMTMGVYHVKARTTRHDTLGHVEKCHALSGI